MDEEQEKMLSAALKMAECNAEGGLCLVREIGVLSTRVEQLETALKELLPKPPNQNADE